jgi:hypothetical protein
MIIIILQSVLKTFFFLRISSELSFLVTMITQVAYDLRIFFCFYVMLIFLFSLIFGVLGIGNEHIDSDYTEFLNELPETWEVDVGGDPPNEQYHMIGPFLGNLIYTFRTSLGDFDTDTSTFLTVEENYVFWVIWSLVTIIGCVVFLNFIISEIGNSYALVKENLESMVLQERSSLIAECEDMTFVRFKDEKKFPKSIV